MILYGRQIKSIAEQLGVSTQEAQHIYDSVLANFPELAEFIKKTQDFAREHGYVETIWGRRRQLPEMQLPLYEFSYADGVSKDFDPLSDEESDTEVSYDDCVKYTNMLYYAKTYKQKQAIFENLRQQGINIKDNSSKIADAERQCVNCVDYETEILTANGWKKYNEIHIGDKILSYNMNTYKTEYDTIKDIHNYPDECDTITFKSQTFEAVSTPNHRWVVGSTKITPKIKTTAEIIQSPYNGFHVIRSADNDFTECDLFSDDALKLLGWYLTDGHRYSKSFEMSLYQSTNKPKNKYVYDDMINTLNRLGLKYSDNVYHGEYYHTIRLHKQPLTELIYNMFPDRELTIDFIFKLSQRQAKILIQVMMQGDGTGVDGNGNALPVKCATICCKTKNASNMFQILCVVGGYATNAYCIDVEKALQHSVNTREQQYDSMNNIPTPRNSYYNVSVLRSRYAHITDTNYTHTKTQGVWCVTTGNGTWIARRNGKVFYTGNSVVQGSAADLTKLAMIELYNNQELKDLGFKMLIPVHDEIIAECPSVNSGRCAELMSQCMLHAGKDLCVPLKCDVDAFYHWYGETLDPQTLKPLSEH